MKVKRPMRKTILVAIMLLIAAGVANAYRSTVVRLVRGHTIFCLSYDSAMRAKLVRKGDYNGSLPSDCVAAGTTTDAVVLIDSGSDGMMFVSFELPDGRTLKGFVADDNVEVVHFTRD